MTLLKFTCERDRWGEKPKPPSEANALLCTWLRGTPVKQLPLSTVQKLILSCVRLRLIAGQSKSAVDRDNPQTTLKSALSVSERLNDW
jgi:hypothetical protein